MTPSLSVRSPWCADSDLKQTTCADLKRKHSGACGHCKVIWLSSKRQNDLDNGTILVAPDASSAITEHFLRLKKVFGVDNIVETTDESLQKVPAQEESQAITFLFQTGGFTVRRWLAPSVKALSQSQGALVAKHCITLRACYVKFYAIMESAIGVLKS